MSFSDFIEMLFLTAGSMYFIAGIALDIRLLLQKPAQKSRPEKMFWCRASHMLARIDRMIGAVEAPQENE